MRGLRTIAINRQSRPDTGEATMNPDAIYEVLAVRYGTHQQRSARDNFMHPQEVTDLHDMELPLDYFVWVIRNAQRTIVVDTGFTHETAERRKRSLAHLPADALKAVGVDAAHVTDVIITHLHYDHAGGLAAFPAATFHVQDSEMNFVTGRCMCHPRLRHAFEVEDVVTMIRRLYDGRVHFVDGDETIFPGVSVHRAPGHTPGLQCVRVETARGAVVLASDACHYYANKARQNPFPILVSLPDMIDSWAKLERLAASPDHVVPGHDPEVLRLYPRGDVGDVAVALLHQPPRAA
jgi:glyoxylase-like metal-dependent hydrolase (beta-lactamase superfamily II)